MRQEFTPPTGSKTTAPAKPKADAIEKKLWDRLLKLPLLPKAQGNYLPFVKTGKLIFLSGQLPLTDNALKSFKGRLGREITIEAGQRAAQLCTLNALALIKNEIGNLEKIKRVVKITGYVAGMPGFEEQPTILNGASDLLVQLFGENGKHARVVVGVTDLPLGACVEIDYIFEMK